MIALKFHINYVKTHHYVLGELYNILNLIGLLEAKKIENLIPIM